MEKQLLFDGEEILLTSADKTVTLTNKRLRKNESSWGEFSCTSIHLEKISSIQLFYKSWIVILILGIILLIGGLYALMVHAQEAAIGAFVLGCICVVIYLITRRHLITVASDGGAKIHILVKGMNRETILDFVNKIENAKSLIK